MAGGRPTEFNETAKTVMLGLHEESKIDAKVVKIVGISVRAVKHWKEQDPEFLLSIKAAKELADNRVEASLYLLATGYSYAAEKVFPYKGRVIRVMTWIHRPPTLRRAFFG